MKNQFALLFLVVLAAMANPEPQLTYQPLYLVPVNPSNYGLRNWFGMSQSSAPAAQKAESPSIETETAEIQDPFSEDETDTADDASLARVINGEVVPSGVLPGFAVLYSKNEVLCGGTLITSRHVLTAASCFESDTDDLSVGLRVLVNTANVVPLDSGMRIRAVQYIWKHPDYSYSTSKDGIIKNNIAILELDAPIRGVRRVRLAKSSRSYENTTGMVYGFGIYKTKDEPNYDTPSYKLRRGSVQILSRDQCEELYPAIGEDNQSSRYFCAVGDQVACAEDMGGPLFVGRRQIGISSFGKCARSPLRNVYTRVRSYAKWIRQVVFDKRDDTDTFKP